MQKVSIIIPTYNGEAYLPSTLEAIYRQRLNTPPEVVCIDSGSTDRTLEILASLGSESPTFEPASQRITLQAPEGAKTLTETVRRLDGAQIVPNDITLRKPTLDDVFLTLTGHVAEDTTAPDGNGGRRGRRKRRGR